MFSNVIKRLSLLNSRTSCAVSEALLFCTTLFATSTYCYWMLQGKKKSTGRQTNGKQSVEQTWDLSLWGRGKGKHFSNFCLSHLHKVAPITNTGIPDKMAGIHCRKSILNFEAKSLTGNISVSEWILHYRRERMGQHRANCICHKLHEIIIFLMQTFSNEKWGEVHPHCSMVFLLGLISSVKGWILTSLRSEKAKSKHEIFTFIPTNLSQDPEAVILPK